MSRQSPSSPKKIAVFCGSNTGNDIIYQQHAVVLAQKFYNNNIELVYGGGNIGLMGILADTLLNLGGKVTGVIPRKLVDIEVAHTKLTQMHIVAGMHERKALMTSLSDAFIIMPGGIGTFDEFFEAFTWLQLGYHHKPIGILNSGGFFDRLFDFLSMATEQGFLSPLQFKRLLIEQNPDKLLSLLLTLL